MSSVSLKEIWNQDNQRKLEEYFVVNAVFADGLALLGASAGTEMTKVIYTCIYTMYIYYQTSNISHTLVGNKIVDHSDVLGAALRGTYPTTSSFST